MTGPGGDAVRIEHGPCAPRAAKRRLDRAFTSHDRPAGNTACLGYARFPRGRLRNWSAHDPEELYFIVRGSGRCADAGSIRQDFAQCN
jgi:hypothetical protein